MPKVALASGFDNADNLKRFKDIDGCLFQLYFDFVQQEWHSYEDRQLTGSRLYKVIGDPWAIWKFPILTVDEWNYFFQTILGGEQSGPVTVHLWNMASDEYEDYNAIMHMNEDAKDSYEWGERRNIEIEFRNLELLS